MSARPALWRITLRGELPGLNEIIDANRRNKYAGAKLKETATGAVAWQMLNIEPLPKRCYDWRLTWHCTTRRRDPDNIYSAVKFIFDALQAAGVIERDGWDYVGSVSHDRVKDDWDGVVVEAFVRNAS